MVVFGSDATNLAPSDGDHLLDVFAHDPATGTTTEISGTPANTDLGQALPQSLSADGSRALYFRQGIGTFYLRLVEVPTGGRGGRHRRHLPRARQPDRRALRRRPLRRGRPHERPLPLRDRDADAAATDRRQPRRRQHRRARDLRGRQPHRAAHRARGPQRQRRPPDRAVRPGRRHGHAGLAHAGRASPRHSRSTSGTRSPTPGPRVLFTSRAGDLVAGNDRRHAPLRLRRGDRRDHARSTSPRPGSRSARRSSDRGSISSDGRFVAFIGAQPRA